MTQFHIGAQGFSSKDWVGTFYPPKTRPADYLGFYSRVFDTVEMNTTFYAIPTPDRVAAWAEGTPDSFRFTAKLPKAITHEKRLVDVEQELRYYCRAIRAFGHKLGAAVIQLPPSFKRDSQADLEAFLALLPADIRFAAEFRHASWQSDDVLDLLRRHGVAWCMNDWRDLASVRAATADIAYLRLNGHHEQFRTLGSVQMDRAAELESWAETLLAMGDQVSHAYVYVNNHYAGHAPATINDLRRLLGLASIDPRSLWDELSGSASQPSLFG